MANSNELIEKCSFPFQLMDYMLAHRFLHRHKKMWLWIYIPKQKLPMQQNSKLFGGFLVTQKIWLQILFIYFVEFVEWMYNLHSNPLKFDLKMQWPHEILRSIKLNIWMVLFGEYGKNVGNFHLIHLINLWKLITIKM